MRRPKDTFAEFQQVSAPVMAKGVEDTAFYRYNRLISLNDVGGNPSQFGISLSAFHASTRTRASRWPHSLLATSTHDSKRSEDVRARINILSEMPVTWEQALNHWNQLNSEYKRIINCNEAPTNNDEYLLYQTLIGTWPLTIPNEKSLAEYRARIEKYMIKAIREGKENSNWVKVNKDYEDAMKFFIQALLKPSDKNLFLADFISYVKPISAFGLLNSLAQILIKLVTPGVPDIYQGCELWQFNLVDPDNRNKIDFFYRHKLLAEIKLIVNVPPERLPLRLLPMVTDMTDGRIKLYTIWQCLTVRKRWPEVFRDGKYVPLNVYGKYAENVFAFARIYGNRFIIALVPRLTTHLLKKKNILPLGMKVWGNTTLELSGELIDKKWNNVFTGEIYMAHKKIELGRLFTYFPICLIIAENL